MILRRLFCLSSLLLASTMGCCHSMCVCSDPCGAMPTACGTMPTGGRYISGWMNQKIDSWRMRNHGRNYGWNDVGCGCDACGMGCGGEVMSSSCATGNCGGGSIMSGPMNGSPAGCACGQSHSEYAPNVPSATSIPAGAPATAPTPVPAPPSGNEPAPAPASSDTNSTAIPRTLATQPQQVSVEEFHRLPGVIVAGPTSQSSVPSVATSTSASQPMMAAPQLSAVPAAPRVASGAQQVNWIPSKQ